LALLHFWRIIDSFFAVFSFQFLMTGPDHVWAFHKHRVA
jgi:hypothetical protein